MRIRGSRACGWCSWVNRRTAFVAPRSSRSDRRRPRDRRCQRTGRGRGARRGGPPPELDNRVGLATPLCSSTLSPPPPLHLLFRPRSLPHRRKRAHRGRCACSARRSNGPGVHHPARRRTAVFVAHDERPRSLCSEVAATAPSFEAIADAGQGRALSLTRVPSPIVYSRCCEERQDMLFAVDRGSSGGYVHADPWVARWMSGSASSMSAGL